MEAKFSPTVAKQIVAWRHHLHAYPELSFEEVETSQFVQTRLNELGIPFEANIGGFAVVATLRRGSSNRSVGLRADTDALPITEESSLPHASKRKGIMHACGHDGHTAALLGAAALLAQDANWNGAIQLIFQPAEERGAGAKAMIADGLFERFPMERLFAFHNWPGLETGVVAIHDGPVFAEGCRLTITIDGLAGHAAMPHLARDTVLAAAHLIVAAQSVVARRANPLDAAVLSIGAIEGGAASNQLPSSIKMSGTIRTYRSAVRDHMIGEIKRIAEGIARSFDVTVNVDVVVGGPAVANGRKDSNFAALVAEKAGLPVRWDVPPSMAAEDFGRYLDHRSGAYVWIGNGVESASLHHPRYEFNDAILPIAASYLSKLAIAALDR
jgi:amidohydrolase